MTEVPRVVRIDPARARAATTSVMSRAQRDIPAFHLTRSMSCGEIVRTAKGEGVSVTAAMLQPVARLLDEFPTLNGHLVDGAFSPSTGVDLGIAVAHRENVLIVVTLRDCASWTACDFGAALAEIRTKNTSNAFAPSDFARPSFTVSNLGGFGVHQFTSIVTPPQVGVLSIGSVRQIPVALGDAIVSEPTVTMTLGLDHRAVDGAYGARALERMAGLLATPENVSPGRTAL